MIAIYTTGFKFVLKVGNKIHKLESRCIIKSNYNFLLVIVTIEVTEIWFPKYLVIKYIVIKMKPNVKYSQTHFKPRCFVQNV